MSIKRNILANYAGQLYVTLIGILLVPMYVQYMGAEAYGLVGFYAMLQAWFQLLDMGLTPTMARETARFQGGAVDALGLRRLLRALEGIFIGIAILGAAAMLAGSDYIASSWLKVQQLPLHEVKNAVMLIALIVALRWVCGLYRGVITGFEKIVWLNGFNIIIATARFALVIPFLIYIGATPTEFFTYQLVVAVIELLGLAGQTYRLLPKIAPGQKLPWQWQPLRKVLKFSLTIAFTSAVWILITQTDKLILSKLLLLSDYAYFTLAVLVASGIMVISGPISGALLPRMTKLNAEGNEVGLIQLYRNATQLVAVIAVPAALVLAFFAEQVLWAWTGNIELARKAAPVLSLYALGNGILALAAFPYYLQFAKGDLKLHLIGNVLFVAIFIPLLIFAVNAYGMVGAGYAWVAANLIPFVFFLPIVHRRFVKGLHTQWLVRDLGAIVLTVLTGAVMAQRFLEWPQTRLSVAVEIGILSLLLLAISAGSSSWVRQTIRIKWLSNFKHQ
ncbi:oligosaccharide flippase family protein [Noviherbaspirillum sedimenti]|uniref:Polysaccharide biosynthesis protein n=1 Tax=Noviherbaspirillum sedimenti TaxID=2320865 RepID=A0A3A3G532_9BURK|nr:oligosaccharide flippase family protein [Noviherbaspirillum sedimenti]RJG02934.1 polysaccharide biosynthesis protein [Noviherbaspirillum sedimenti]